MKVIPKTSITSLVYIEVDFAKTITFPSATLVVAISSTKLSPSLAGAATHIGLVPRVS